MIEQKNSQYPSGKAGKQQEEKILPKGEAGDTGTIGLHGFSVPGLKWRKMLSIPVMKSYLLI